jgi:MraZ protein
MLRGNAPATIDAKGRLKIPTAFRRAIEDKHGSDFFVTSIDGEGVRLYPFPVWLEMEKKMADLPSLGPEVDLLQDLFSYYGAEATMDKQGRLVIQQHLRESAEMKGEVAVLGKTNYLEVWNDQRFRARLQDRKLSREDRRILAAHGL